MQNFSPDLEWLETDGFGGFSSGCVDLVRRRRYHALLMRAVDSPSHRFILVNGFDAKIVTSAGEIPLSAQRYQPGVTSPDGQRYLQDFSREPWPTWKFPLPDGRVITQEIFVVRDAAATVVTWTIEGDSANAILEVKPFLSGRDPHSLQHENSAFQFTPETRGDTQWWTPYEGIPPIALKSNGRYTHAPEWYRKFLYDIETARGLDDTEDLAVPGMFSWDFGNGPAVLILGSPTDSHRNAFNAGAVELASEYRHRERKRRRAALSPLHLSADDYLVRRGSGHTIIAGYPWFTDWGRDTFISLRGLCLATGRLDVAGSILREWSGLVSAGMLPNFFPEGAAQPEFNSVDASLWFVIAAHDYLTLAEKRGTPVPAMERAQLHAAIAAIVEGYSSGTRFNIRADTDGLLNAGQTGVQITWMDAKVGDWVVTPRIGKPVEVQALWINALHIAAAENSRWREVLAHAKENFAQRFWNAERECLYDVIDVNYRPGEVDDSVRPNQVFAIGGLPYPLLTGGRAEKVMLVVEAELLTPLGLRSLEPGNPHYVPHYRGGVLERDGAYHQGTVWPWLIGPFVEGWLRVNGNTEMNRMEARERFLSPLHEHLAQAGLGHITEVADGDPPFTPGGCPFQAWSLGELLRLEQRVLQPERTEKPAATTTTKKKSNPTRPASARK